MAETIKADGYWSNKLAECDLVNQAGLNRDDFQQEPGYFLYLNRKVIMSHSYNDYLIVSMIGKEDSVFKKLIDSYSTIIGYDPFCKYLKFVKTEVGNVDLWTYEWNSQDLETRVTDLNLEDTVSNLIRINLKTSKKKMN